MPSVWYVTRVIFFFQAEDGIRCLVRSRGLGDVYKRQVASGRACGAPVLYQAARWKTPSTPAIAARSVSGACLLYTSDAADERSSVDLGGRRIIKKKKTRDHATGAALSITHSTLRRYGEE